MRPLSSCDCWSAYWPNGHKPTDDLVTPTALPARVVCHSAVDRDSRNLGQCLSI